MKATELRLENLIYTDDGDLITVDCDMLRTLSFPYSCYWYGGIPITEEWLLKFGFEDWGKNEWEQQEYVLHNIIDGTSNFIIALLDGKVYPTIDQNCCCWANFKYVHQLQNLYFALTGNELTIQDNERKNT